MRTLSLELQELMNLVERRRAAWYKSIEVIDSFFIDWPHEIEGVVNLIDKELKKDRRVSFRIVLSEHDLYSMLFVMKSDDCPEFIPDMNEIVWIDCDEPEPEDIASIILHGFATHDELFKVKNGKQTGASGFDDEYWNTVYSTIASRLEDDEDIQSPDWKIPDRRFGLSLNQTS